MTKKAIVVGAGPSGLMSAVILSDQGYEVTVYEKDATFGGRVQTAILPNSGITVQTGPMFIHDSKHPVAALYSGKGRYYESESLGSKLKQLVYFGITKPITSSIFNKIQDILAQHHDEVSSLSWQELIGDIYSKNPTYCASKAIRNSISGKCLTTFVSQKTFKEMIQDEGIFIDSDSVLSYRYYSGNGDDKFIPQEGCRHAVDSLYEIACAKGVEFQFNSSLTALDDSGIDIETQGETCHLSADKTVIAISPFGYQNITADPQLIKNAALCAGHNGQGVDVTKYAIVFDQSISDIGRMRINLGLSGIGGFIYSGPENDKLLYALIYNERWYRNGDETCKDNLHEMVVEEIKKHVNEIMRNKGGNGSSSDTEGTISGVEHKVFDEKTWAQASMGFDPVNSTASKLVHVGAISGANDAIHAVMTSACHWLGVKDPDKYMQHMFGAPNDTPIFDDPFGTINPYGDVKSIYDDIAI